MYCLYLNICDVYPQRKLGIKTIANCDCTQSLMLDLIAALCHNFDCLSDYGNGVTLIGTFMQLETIIFLLESNGTIK